MEHQFSQNESLGNQSLWEQFKFYVGIGDIPSAMGVAKRAIFGEKGKS